MGNENDYHPDNSPHTNVPIIKKGKNVECIYMLDRIPPIEERIFAYPTGSDNDISIYLDDVSLFVIKCGSSVMTVYMAVMGRKMGWTCYEK